MFDPSLAELLLIAVIALVVLGPERLPVVARKLGRFIGTLQRMFVGFQHEMQRHMNTVEHPLEDVKKEIQTGLKQFQSNMDSEISDIEKQVQLKVAEEE